MPLAAFPKCFLDALCVRRDMTVDQWIDLAQQFDVDGLEFYWGFTPVENPKEWERLREKVARQGRSIPMMCYSSDFTRPALAERKEEIEKQKQAIRATAALGGTFCRVLSGQRRPDVKREQGLAWVRECISELLPFAEENKIVLVIENHYKDGYWQYPEFAQKMEDFLELLNGIPESKWFGVNYDPSNAIIAGDDPLELLEAVKHRVKTMHASDRYFEGGTLEDLRRLEAQPQTGYATFLKHGVIGRGSNDYDRIFSILKSVGFNGWVSIEDGPDPETGIEDIAQSAIYLREKMRQYGLK
ncbi:MAG TPA: sugar phosphate isomerase/epimerase family protein [Candidatus Saccharimonadales bacterium]|nr:sugar phosphate isomerase/epimerase family protein [Candidatus Saccharimonadales bacterium]